MKRTRQEKGITLIALIITIVVLLILAVVAIRAVQGDGIINYAKNARDDYQAAQDEEQTQLQNYLDILNEENGGSKTEENTPNNVVSTTEEGVPIPVGFKYVEGTKNTGLVIENETEGSQFVWVPVTEDIIAYGLGTTSRREPDVITHQWDNDLINTIEGGDNNPDNLKIINDKIGTTYSNSNDFLTALQQDFNLMATSVNKYDGFYVGRYETSIASNGTAQSKAWTEENQITSATAEKTSANTWYGLYALQKTYSTSSVQGSMIWGSQYNAMMTWMKNTGTDVDSGINGYNKTNNPGTAKDDVINNVYDLYGNKLEWTLEADGGATRALRGTDHNYTDLAPNFYNGNSFVNYASLTGDNGSRLTLYII